MRHLGNVFLSREIFILKLYHIMICTVPWECQKQVKIRKNGHFNSGPNLYRIRFVLIPYVNFYFYFFETFAFSCILFRGSTSHADHLWCKLCPIGNLFFSQGAKMYCLFGVWLGNLSLQVYKKSVRLKMHSYKEGEQRRVSWWDVLFSVSNYF